MAVAISSHEAACAPSTGSKSREIEFPKYCSEMFQSMNVFKYRDQYLVSHIYIYTRMYVWMYRCMKLKNTKPTYLLNYSHTTTTTLHSNHERSETAFTSSSGSFCLLHQLSTLIPGSLNFTSDRRVRKYNSMHTRFKMHKWKNAIR